MILALAGGVGGAKLADGLAQVLQPQELTIAVNTGDDFEHLGLHVSPDLDTVMYTLAKVANPATGWGLRDETWSFMQSLEKLGGPAWFRLGDRDLATHVERTWRLRAGESLSSITERLCGQLGIRHAIVPMSDEPVRTIVHTESGALEFQRYFVREKCEPKVTAIEYRGAPDARPARRFHDALTSGALEGIVFCPSNPYLSVGPILEIPTVRALLDRARTVIAVSPIVAGRALKGPADKIMRELGSEPSALGIARYYRGVIRTLVIDAADAGLAPAIRALGIEPVVADTVMRVDEDRVRLAQACVALARRLPEKAR